MRRYFALKNIILYVISSILTTLVRHGLDVNVDEFLHSVLSIHCLTFLIVPVYLLGLSFGFYFFNYTVLLVRCGSRRFIRERIKTVLLHSICYSLILLFTIYLFAGFQFGFTNIALLYGTQMFLKTFLLFFVLGMLYLLIYAVVRYYGRIMAFGMAYLIIGLDFFWIIMGHDSFLLFRFTGFRQAQFFLTAMIDVLCLGLIAVFLLLCSNLIDKKKEVL